jgi:hypothetical protein
MAIMSGDVENAFGPPYPCATSGGSAWNVSCARFTSGPQYPEALSVWAQNVSANVAPTLEMNYSLSSGSVLMAWIEIAPGPQVPASPSSVANGTPSARQVNVSWTNPPGSLVNDTVYWAAGGSCAGAMTAHSLGSAGTSYTITTLSPNTAYSVAVTAWNATGQSPQSNCLHVTTAGILPAAPTSLTATDVNSTKIHLSWTNPGGGGLTDNHVYEYAGSSCGGFASVMDLGAVQTTFDDTGLTGSTTYSYKISASNLTGESAKSACANVTTTPSVVPGPPTALTATTFNSTEIDLAWVNPSGGGLTDNHMYLYSGASCAGFASVLDLSSVVTSYDVGALTPNTTYSFKVSASNSTGIGPLSACAHNTTAPIPPLPSLTITTVTLTSFTESWSNGSWVNVTYVELVIANDSVSCQGNEHGAATWTYNVSLVLTHWITQTGGVVSYEYNGTQGLNFSFLPGETVWVGLLYSTSGSFTNETACQQVTFATIAPPPAGGFDIFPLICLAIVAGILVFAITRRKKQGEWWG